MPENRYWLPNRISVPRDGWLGGMPMPRNDSVASVRMAMPKFSVAATRMGVMVLGRIWRNMIRRAGTLSSCAACTYSLRRSTEACARTVRAYCIQADRAIATTRTAPAPISRRSGGKVARAMADTSIAIRMVGTDSSTSPTRISTLSVKPPK